MPSEKNLSKNTPLKSVTQKRAHPFSSLLLPMLSLSCAFLLASCKASNLDLSSNSQAGALTSAQNQTATVRGTAVDGFINQGTVVLTTFPPGAAVLGSATTNIAGSFSIQTTPIDPAGLYQLTLTGGSSIDFASGYSIALSSLDSLSTLVTGKTLISSPVTMTVMTTLMANQAQGMVNKGETPLASFQNALGLWSGLMGFDPTTTPVTDPTAGPESMGAPAIYGLLLAGFSQMAMAIGVNDHLSPGASNTLGLLSVLNADISDGVLDGLKPGDPNPLTYFTYTLTPETLRKDIADSTLEFLWGDRNKSGLAPIDVSGSVNALALDSSSLFPGNPLPTLPDPGSPQITVSSPVNNAYYNNTLPLVATASDALGIGSFTVTSTTMPLPVNPPGSTSIQSSVDILDIPDGPLTTVFSAENLAGTVSTQTISLAIDNTAPTLQNLSPISETSYNVCGSTNYSVQVTGQMVDTGSGPSRIQVQETAPVAQAISAYSTVVNRTTSNISFYVFAPVNTPCKAVTFTYNITVYDALNNQRTIPYSMVIAN
jgi:hypothetical protein